jgi:cation transport ATPase
LISVILALLIAPLFCGCVTKAEAGARERAAYLAGQKAALASVGVGQGVTVIGAVEHPNVPWVEGLTLSQAIATANYTSHRNPKTITIIRNGETVTVPPRQLIGGHVVLLQPGDTIKIE